MDRPNIVLIISDQQRQDTLGFLGRSACRTPHIDRLQADGISFDRAMTPSPLCGPARAALFSGRYPHQCAGETEPNKQSVLTEEEYDAGATNMLTIVQ